MEKEENRNYKHDVNTADMNTEIIKHEKKLKRSSRPSPNEKEARNLFKNLELILYHFLFLK